MKILQESIKYLPNSLQVLSLNLSWNSLEINTGNMKYLANIMKKLPDNLNNL